MPRLVREVLIAGLTLFLGSWGISTGFGLMSTPSDGGVIAGLLIVVAVLLTTVAVLARYFRMLRLFIERNHPHA